MPPKCKYKSNKDRHGPYPLTKRFGVDQVPLEMNSRHYTLETKGTTDAVFIRGPKKDIEKRQATLQPAIRVKVKQIVKPTLIMRNENPAENRYEFPPGLASRKVKFEGKKGREDEFYDKRVDVMWQEKAWADEIVSTQYLENFNQQVMLVFLSKLVSRIYLPDGRGKKLQ